MRPAGIEPASPGVSNQVGGLELWEPGILPVYYERFKLIKIKIIIISYTIPNNSSLIFLSFVIFLISLIALLVSK